MKLIPKNRYDIDDPNDNVLVLVNIDKFLSRFKKDSPELYVGSETKNISSVGSIKSATDFINNYAEDPRYINHKTGQRMVGNEVMFVPTEASMYNGKLGITNGRHRMVALKNLGYTYAYIEVPQDQKNLFIDLA